METTGNNKTSSPTFIKKTPAGRYTAQKSETKGKYQTLKNITGHRDRYKRLFLRETKIGWVLPQRTSILVNVRMYEEGCHLKNHSGWSKKMRFTV